MSQNDLIQASLSGLMLAAMVGGLHPYLMLLLFMLLIAPFSIFTYSFTTA